MRHLVLLLVLFSIGCGTSMPAIGEVAVPANERGSAAFMGESHESKALNAVVALLTSGSGFRVSENALQSAVVGECEGRRFEDKSIGLVSWEFQCKRSPLRSIVAEFLPGAGRINQILVYFDQSEFNEVAQILERKWGAPETRESEFVGWVFQAARTLPESDRAAVPAATLQISGGTSKRMSLLTLTVEPPEE